MTATGVAGDPDDAAAAAHAEDLASLHVSEPTDLAALVPMSAELGSTDVGDMLTADAIEKVNAGAQLTYALYHAGKDFWTGQCHSQALLKAYMRAQQAYGLGRAGLKDG